ncbi:hypothetical protein [Marinobacter daepoensis]|nr:hypothetical protein [Marinobacter daepoensis]
MPAFFDVRDLAVCIGSTTILHGQVAGGLYFLQELGCHGQS